MKLFCLILSFCFAQKKNVDVQFIEKPSMSHTVANMFKTNQELCPTKINTNEVMNQTSYSQGQSNWCSSFASSQFLSQIVDEPISPAFNAIMMSKTTSISADIELSKRKTTQMDGSSFAQTLSMLNNLGYYCAEKDMPTGYRETENFKQDYDLIEEYNPKDIKNYPKVLAAIQFRFPHLKYEAAKRILTQIRPQDRLYYLTNENCKDHKKYFKNKFMPKLFLSEAMTSRQFQISKIDEVINNGKVAGIVYDLRQFIKKGSDVELKHSSVVIGRRYNERNDKCEYLIKNSYGNKCAMYKDNVDCSQKEVAGSVWVNQEQLENAIYYIVDFSTVQKKQGHHENDALKLRNNNFKN